MENLLALEALFRCIVHMARVKDGPPPSLHYLILDRAETIMDDIQARRGVPFDVEATIAIILAENKKVKLKSEILHSLRQGLEAGLTSAEIGEAMGDVYRELYDKKEQADADRKRAAKEERAGVRLDGPGKAEADLEERR
jgi:hypothetical protein